MRVFRFLLLILSVFALVSCESSDQKDPDQYLLGTTCKILESKGNYSYFIEALNRSGYYRLVDGGGLVTVFAPDDNAFKNYLESKYGTIDMAQVPSEDISLLVGCHMIQFAYNKEDFLSFSTSSSEDNSGTKKSFCYKYKTYGREAIEDFTDPVSRRKVKLFSREKYLPVFSTRMFSSRGISDAESDYRKLFPDVDWQGSDDRLYAGNATVIESGIPTDNGYLYIVDKVIEPSKTIYKEMSSSLKDNYSISKRLFDEINFYQYNAEITKNYSSTGDSLFYHYSWSAPTRSGEIPEIASEWTYHDESGVVFDRMLRYSTNCFLPSDDVLEPYLKELFKEYGTYAQEDFVSVIPRNAIFHILRAHIYGGKDFLFPSELDKNPINGINGERFNVSSSEIADVKYCSNGIIYGMEKVFEPAVFTRLTAPLLRYPQFTFYARAFNTKNMYQQMVDINNRFTLFVQDDQDLAVQGYSSGESTVGYGNYTFRNKAGNMGAAAVSNLLMSQYLFGELPAPEDTDNLRYFVAKDEKTYFYMRDKNLYDYSGKPISVKTKFDTENGVVYQLDRVIPPREGPYSETGKLAEFQEFKKLMIQAGLGNNSGGLVSPMTDAIIFFPTNGAITAAIAAGKIPLVVDGDATELRKYLQYYFLQLKKNKLSSYLLPGLGPDGMTVNTYSGNYITMSESATEADAKRITFSWTPASSESVTITDMGGYSITTQPSVIYLRTNCACYVIEECFDYRTMYGN